MFMIQYTFAETRCFVYLKSSDIRLSADGLDYEIMVDDVADLIPVKRVKIHDNLYAIIAGKINSTDHKILCLHQNGEFNMVLNEDCNHDQLARYLSDKSRAEREYEEVCEYGQD